MPGPADMRVRAPRWARHFVSAKSFKTAGDPLWAPMPELSDE
jgi:hypothetical protein